MVRSGWPALARVAGESRGAEEVRAVVQHHWSPEASAPIVHRLFERSQLQPDVLLVIAMISGSKRLSVGAFARVAQLSERTLEDDWPLHDSRARVGSWLGRLCFTQYGDLKCPGNG
jgi:hypothetical protein